MLTESRSTRRSLALRLAVCACPLILTLPASASITVGGDAGEVSPADPATWTITTAANIGTNAGKTGTLTLDGGSVVNNLTGIIGYNANSTGFVTVTGLGSAWANSDVLTLGFLGTGTLTISSGGAVSNTDAFVGRWVGSTGHATVTGAGSTWTSSGSLVVGTDVPGTLTIEKGGNVSSALGYVAGGKSVSYATVSGAGSSWTTSSSLCVGQWGTGTLRITDGAKVSSGEGVMGIWAPSPFNGSGVGYATVTGTGSTWTNAGQLLVGYEGTATLAIANGGHVTARWLSVNSTSAISLHVRGSDMLVLGNAAAAGTVANAGKINLYADSSLASGTYSPISDLSNRTMTWSGAGSCNAFGGTWDNTAKTFTVAAALPASAGDNAPVTTGQRLTITDATGTHHIGVSFGTVPDGSTFSATPMTADQLTSLALAPGQSVASAWDFTTNLAGSTVLLSFDVGPEASNLQAWHYTAGAWTPVTTDLTYANGIASFTVDSFSGYAVTAAVPEPTTLSLLALCSLTLLRRRQHRRIRR